MKIDVVTLNGGAKKDSVELDESIFGLEPRKDILHRMVTYQLAKRQQGTHKTKERGEVAGSTKKFVRQKGSGGARHGNRKAPQFVGGGKAHGPRVRSHAIALPKKVRKLALKHALSAKYSASELVVVEHADLSEAKTQNLKSYLAKLGLENALVVDTEVNDNFKLSARNLPNVDVLPVTGANVYDILRCEKLVLTKSAIEGLEARLK